MGLDPDEDEYADDESGEADPVQEGKDTGKEAG